MKTINSYTRNQLSTTSKGLQLYISQQLGYILQILNTTERKKLSIATINVFVLPAIELEQILFAFCERSGQPRGYITWAFVTASVAESLKSDKNRILSRDEWNEGDLIWIMDVVAPFGDAHAIIQQFLSLNKFYGKRIQAIRTLRKNGSVPRFIDRLAPKLNKHI